jgi:hypothetical protein
VKSADKAIEKPIKRDEKRIGAGDSNWPDWYAEYMVRELSGKELPQRTVTT